APRCAPWTVPNGSAPTTSPRTGSPTTAPATRPTTSTSCWTASSNRSSTRWSPPTSPHGSSASVTEPAASVPQVLRAATQRFAEAGVASPRVDAEILLAFVLDVERTQLMLIDDLPAAANAEYDALI